MTDDKINPTHYKSGGLESIQIIDAFQLNFNLGNATKYILRNGRKKGERRVEGLKKAIWYLKHEIQTLQQMEPKA